MVSLAAGSNLTPRFQLVRRFPQSGMGEVWLAEDRELSERVVVKIVPPELVDFLKHECRSARKLVHPNIARIHDLHRTEVVSFVTMAHVDGVGLGLFEGRPLEELLPILVPLADALDYAHRQGIVHGELEPASVLVDSSGAPHLVDFGIPRLHARTAAEPSVKDDIYGFGALVFRLLTEETPGAPLHFPESIPERVRPLLSSMLSAEPSMAEVRRELEALRDRKSAPELVPPLRIPGAEASLPSRSPDESGIGWKTITAFAVLTAAAVSVFAVLPKWVESRRVTEARTAPAEAALEPLPAEAPDLRDLALEKTAAEEAREGAARARNALESRNAARWGGDLYREALSRFSEGDALLREREYRRGAERFGEASRGFAEIESRAREVLAEAIRKGEGALESGRSSDARDLFARALEIDPASEAAKLGLARAESLDEVLALVAAGEELERRGELPGAAERFRRAVALDPRSLAAQAALSRVDAKASERAFAASMSEAVAALGREDFASARAALERAKTIRPSAPEIEDGLAQVEEGLRSRAIAGHRERARALESAEEWRSAVKEYDSVLALDPTVRFALEGKTRSEARALLQDKLDFQIANSGRLSDENALREASLLLDEARAAEPAGPKHRARIAKLEAHVSSYSIPVAVELLSDSLTEITVYKVGRLGKFERRSLELRPGRYTVVGSRPGYRDVRHEIHVQSGKPAEPLFVRCEEKI